MSDRIVRTGRVRRVVEKVTRKPTYVAAIDFDGTIFDNGTGQVFHGAKAVIDQLVEAGARIIIHTCRARAPQGQPDPDFHLAHYSGSQAFVAETLEANGIHYDEITALKPMADVYVDDKAVRFAPHEGKGWDQIATELLADAYRARWKQ